MQTTSRLRRVTGCLLLSAAVFALLVLAATSVNAGFRMLRSHRVEQSLTEWRYHWSDDRSKLEDFFTLLPDPVSQSTIHKPGSPFVPAYLRLSTSLPSLDSNDGQPMVLTVYTAGNPLKVCVGGRTVYDNGYDDGALYAGNRSQEIALTGASAGSQLDIYLAVPYAFSLTAAVSRSAQPRFWDVLAQNLGLISGSVFFIFSLLTAFFLSVFAIRGKNAFPMIWLILLLTVNGAGAFLLEISYHSALITSPALGQVQIALLMLSALLLYGIAVATAGGWRPMDTVSMTLSAALMLTFLLIDDSMGVRLIPLSGALLLWMAIAAFRRLSHSVRGAGEFARLMMVGWGVGWLSLAFDTVILYTGWPVPWPEMRYVGLSVFSLAQLYALVRRELRIRVLARERERQLETDNLWVEKTITCCAGIFAQQNVAGFCRETARAIKHLLLYDYEHSEPSLKPAPAALEIHMALVMGGQYHEIYTENTAGPFPYAHVIDKVQHTTDKPVLFGPHSLDMLLYSQEEPVCVLHIDGIAHPMSPYLINSLRRSYNGIAAAFNSIELKQDMEELQKAVFINLAEITEIKETGTGEHLRRVSEMVAVLCRAWGLCERETKIISIASMMHDIGKLAVPDSILTKRGQLDDNEFAMMQDHIIYGYSILSKAPGEFMAAAAVIAQQHHEKYDGTGYLELKGEDIHLYARIVAIIDVFDALLSVRSYKDAWSSEDAFRYITEHAGTHFDPQLVEVFQRCREQLLDVRRHYA